MSGFRPKKEPSPVSQPVQSPGEPKTSRETPAAVKRFMALLRTALFFLAFATTAAWALGVRVYPEALRPVERAVLADTVLELHNGQSVAGRIVSEGADSIVFLMEGSEVPFSKKEIRDIRPTTAGESAMGASSRGKRSLFKIHPELSLYYKIKNKKNLWP